MAEVKDNLIQLEVVYSKLNKALDENINRLNIGATAVENYNKKISVIPSQYQKSLQDIRITLDEVKNANLSLTKAEKESANAILKTNTVIRSDIATRKAQATETKRLEVETNKLKITNEKLASAYNQLSQKEAESARRVQDLIARGKTATQTQREYNIQLRNAQREFTGYRTKVLQADAAVGRWNRTGERSIGFMRNLAGAFGVVGGVTLFATLTREVFQTTKELQSLDNALRQVSGTQEQMARSQAFLRDVSESFGLEINGLTKQFTQFYVSAKDKLSGTQIENIFRSVSKAGATMGLSVENQERAFLALNQMMSKGTIQAEELRGQLGEALPGAFSIMAKAVGVTEKELGGLMKSGQLLADEVLPKFARELEKVYGIETINRVETLTASQNRLANSWTEFVRSLNESETGGISQFFQFIVNGLNGVVNMLIRANTAWDSLFKQAGAKGKEAGKAFFEAQISEGSGVKLTAKQKALIKGRIDEIKEMLKFGYNDPNLKKELSDLYSKLAPSKEFNAESLGNLSEKKIDLYTNKIAELNKKLKEVESNKVTNAIKGALGLNQGKGDLKKEIEKANFDLAYWKQVSESAKNFGNVIDDVTDKELNFTKAKKEKVKVQKEEEQLIFGTEAWLKKQISLLEETRSKTQTTSDGYKEIGGSIAYYSKWLETLIGAQKKSNEETEKTLKYGTIEYYESLQNELKALQQTQVDNNEEFDKFQKQIDFYQVLIDAIRGVKKETKELTSETNDYFESFIDSFSDNSGFSKTFDILREKIDDFGKDAKTTALAISEAFQEAFNTISQASQANFDSERKRVNEQYEFSVKLAGDSETAKEELARQKEIKLKAIQRREAEAQKRLAIFNIAIDTAQAVMAAAPKIPLMVAMGVLGAAQIAMVSSQQIPEFWRGTENAPEGWALTQEKGAEVITDKYGKVKTYGNDKGAQMTYLNRGDKVYNAQKSEAYINKELAKNGIMPMRQSIINNNENNGLSKEDFNNGISKLAKSFKSQQPSSNTSVYLNNKKINTDYSKGKKV
jgi:tape measure domain-containing protein